MAIYPAKGLIGGGFGDLDDIDGLHLIDGDSAMVITDAGVYHYTLDASSGETENSPYIISPDANPGTKRWVLVTPQAPFSHVFANTDAGQDIVTGAPYTIIYGTEVIDTLSEYDHTTGIFTATYDGYYSVCAGIVYELSESWSVGKVAYGFIYVDSTVKIQTYGRISVTAAQRFAVMPPVGVVYVAAGETITVKTQHTEVDNRALENIAVMNYLTIDRIA